MPCVTHHYACECREKMLADRIEELERALRKSLRQHYYCEDSWYSCPMHPDGSANGYLGNECNCGADDWNAYVNALLASDSPDAAPLTKT